VAGGEVLVRRVVSGIALDQASHQLYLSHLDGQISQLNAQTGEVTRRWTVAGNGLAGLVVANEQVYAVNGPERSLIQLDLSSGETRQSSLGIEPGAVAVGPRSGALYLLGLDASAIVTWDMTANSEIARQALGDDAPPVASDLAAETVWLRPRMAISTEDERLYVIEPEAAALIYSRSAVLETE